MNILFLSDNYPPETNAAATRVSERAAYWAAWGHDVTVVTSFPNFPQGRIYDGYRNEWHREEVIDGIRVVRVKTFIAPNSGRLLRVLDFISFFLAAVLVSFRLPRPDVVVATSPQFFSAVAGWVIGGLKRRPFVFELGDIWPASIVAVGAMRRTWSFRLVEALELFLYRRSACVVALTEAFKHDLTGRGIDGDKIAVVINGVDLPRYHPRERDESLAADWGVAGHFVVGYVGTHGMAHNLGNVLDAARHLSRPASTRFLLVGDGAERRQLVARVAAEAIAAVAMIPPQPKALMPRIWSLCDVALVHLRDSPTFADVIPSKIFEAMAMGLPILLCAPKGEASRIIETTGSGIVVPPDDPQALATAVDRMVADPEGLREMARRSLEAAPHYSRERQAKRMIAVLTKAAAGGGAGVGRLSLDDEGRA